jgi:hypothetical protein
MLRIMNAYDEGLQDDPDLLEAFLRFKGRGFPRRALPRQVSPRAVGPRAPTSSGGQLPRLEEENDE